MSEENKDLRHSHHHSPEVKKRQLNRLAKVVGHLKHVQGLIEDDVDCAEVLMQLAACKSALDGLAKSIINEHMEHCVEHAVKDGDMEALQEFQKVIQKYM